MRGSLHQRPWSVNSHFKLYRFHCKIALLIFDRKLLVSTARTRDPQEEDLKQLNKTPADVDPAPSRLCHADPQHIILINLSIYLYVFKSIFIYMLYLSIFIYTYNTYLSISIYIYLSLSISIYIYLYLHISLSISIYIYLYLSIYLSSCFQLFWIHSDLAIFCMQYVDGFSNTHAHM